MPRIPFDQFQAAIFDMDGTMIDNMKYHEKAWIRFLDEHDISLTQEEFKAKLHGKKNDEIFRNLFGADISQERIAKLTDEKESLYRELYMPNLVEISGLSYLIAKLEDKGLKLAIATTAPRANRDSALRGLGLEGKFGVILGSEDVKHGKPHPEIYLATSAQLKVEPAKCLVFEDSAPGIQSAKSAGMKVVAISSTHTTEELGMADYCIANFKQIEF